MPGLSHVPNQEAGLPTGPSSPCSLLWRWLFRTFWSPEQQARPALHPMLGGHQQYRQFLLREEVRLGGGVFLLRLSLISAPVPPAPVSCLRQRCPVCPACGWGRRAAHGQLPPRHLSFKKEIAVSLASETLQVLHPLFSPPSVAVSEKREPEGICLPFYLFSSSSWAVWKQASQRRGGTDREGSF